MHPAVTIHLTSPSVQCIFDSNLSSIINLKPFIMKKNLLLLPLVLAVTVLTAAAADPGKKDVLAERAFQKQFSGAQNISWTKTNDGLHQVSFVWGGLRTVAFFNGDAEMVGSIRNVFFSHLPLTVLRSVETNFANPVVVEVTEITNQEGTSYNILLEEKNKKYKVRVNSYGDVLQKDKLRK